MTWTKTASFVLQILGSAAGFLDRNSRYPRAYAHGPLPVFDRFNTNAAKTCLTSIFEASIIELTRG
jgi:hypothetical protein